MVFMYLNKTFSFLLLEIVFHQEYFLLIMIPMNVNILFIKDFEYLSEEQIREMSLSSSLYREEMTVLGGKTIKQYTREMKKNDKFNESIKITTFSQPPSQKDFALPASLLPKETRINLNI